MSMDAGFDAEPSSPAVTLVIPVYNEAHRFQRYAPELADFIAGCPRGSELVFVDDGSLDTTCEFVERFISLHPDVSVRLVRQHHRGKGAAVAAGIYLGARRLWPL